jgi:uncharacterized protein (TIGR00725 family)
MKAYQIGVMGSVADLDYANEFEQAATVIGRLIAERGGILFFGAEKDGDSLSTCAFKGAQSANGITVGVTYGKGQDIWSDPQSKPPTIIIPAGLVRGGGRELTLVLSCAAIIAISGGSGTLTEIAIAYQARIPCIALSGFGGWADKLADTFLDGRNRLKIFKAHTPEEAVRLAFQEAEEYRSKQSKNNTAHL